MSIEVYPTISTHRGSTNEIFYIFRNGVGAEMRENGAEKRMEDGARKIPLRCSANACGRGLCTLYYYGVGGVHRIEEGTGDKCECDSLSQEEMERKIKEREELEERRLDPAAIDEQLEILSRNLANFEESQFGQLESKNGGEEIKKRREEIKKLGNSWKRSKQYQEKDKREKVEIRKLLAENRTTAEIVAIFMAQSKCKTEKTLAKEKEKYEKMVENEKEEEEIRELLAKNTPKAEIVADFVARSERKFQPTKGISEDELQKEKEKRVKKEKKKYEKMVEDEAKKIEQQQRAAAGAALAHHGTTMNCQEQWQQAPTLVAAAYCFYPSLYYWPTNVGTIPCANQAVVNYAYDDDGTESSHSGSNNSSYLPFSLNGIYATIPMTQPENNSVPAAQLMSGQQQQQGSSPPHYNRAMNGGANLGANQAGTYYAYDDSGDGTESSHSGSNSSYLPFFPDGIYAAIPITPPGNDSVPAAQLMSGQQQQQGSSPPHYNRATNDGANACANQAGTYYAYDDDGTESSHSGSNNSSYLPFSLNGIYAAIPTTPPENNSVPAAQLMSGQQQQQGSSPFHRVAQISSSGAKTPPMPPPFNWPPPSSYVQMMSSGNNNFPHYHQYQQQQLNTPFSTLASFLQQSHGVNMGRHF